jgi:type I restriction enzyme S subunit
MKGWETKTLKELCSKITDGVHHTPKYTDTGIPFLSVKNLTQGVINFNDTKFISPEDHKILIKRCKPEIQDILYTKVGTTGIAKIVDTEREFSIFVSVALLKPKHSLIFNKYLEHYLNSSFGRQQAQKRTRGMANQNLVLKDIKEIKIALPPLDEQKRIVAILDEAFEGIDRAIANTQKNLANARELFDSYLNSIFSQKAEGWEEKKLGDICQVKDGTHFYPKNSKDGKYMYITAKNIKPYYIDLTKITFISEEDHQKIYSRCPVKKGDVLYIKDGATAGIAAINNFEE